MSPREGLPSFLVMCFPRVSGDEPQGLHLRPLQNGFSPRERG